MPPPTLAAAASDGLYIFAVCRHALLAGGAGARSARVRDTTAPSAAACLLDWADAPAPRRAGRVCALAWARGGAFATGDECCCGAHLTAEAEALAL
jgi:hypothetical protein